MAEIRYGSMASVSDVRAGAILPIGAGRFVKDHGQGWRLRHRVRRAQRALEGDLARFDTGAPGGCDFLARSCGGHRRRLAWSWSRRPGVGLVREPSPLWPGGS